QGKGVVVVTAHVSNWDILAAASAVYGYPISAGTNDLPSGGLNELVIASRERIGMKMIGLGPGSLRQILKALGRNEVVALASDLYSGDRGVRVPFFNRPAMFPSGPAALALKTGAPILPVWCRRQPDNLYVAEVEEPIEVSRTGDTQRDIQLTTERIVQFFERIIRREPDQWLAFLPACPPARGGHPPRATRASPVVITSLAFRMIEGVIARLPRRLAYALGVIVSTLAFPLLSRQRKALESNLHHVFPEMPRPQVRKL